MKEYTRDSKLHMAYSFELLGKEFSASFIQGTLEKFYENNKESWPCWSFSNHDVERHLSRWDPEESKEFAKLTSALLLSLKGTPCLYQGEELGQTETRLEFEELTDPPGIRYWPENKGRDGCRTPMTWNRNSLNAGFSPNKPWLPVKDKQKLNSVNTQEEDDKSVLNFYKEFLNLRSKTDELLEGDIEFLPSTEDVLIFARETNTSKLVCVFNLNRDKHLFEEFKDHQIGVIISSNTDFSDNKIEIYGYGFMIFSVK
jgi:alpha-glucosidase